MKRRTSVQVHYRRLPGTPLLPLPADIRVKPVVGCGALYSVTSSGLVIAHHRIRPFLLRQSIDNADYVRAVLHVRGKRIMAYVHRLVAEAFYPTRKESPIYGTSAALKGIIRQAILSGAGMMKTFGRTMQQGF